MSRYYTGKYTPKNPKKYNGDVNKIVYRSSWERSVFRWLDLNPDVNRWNSEEIVIPYICRTDNKPHRYFLDFAVEFKSGKVLLIEVKPNSQTKPPAQPKDKRRHNKYIKESLTYAKNISKWEAAKKFAESNGAEFQIWDENTLNSLGIRITKKYQKKKKPNA